MAGCQIATKLAKLADDAVTVVHTNVNKASESKANSFILCLHTMNDDNHKNSMSFGL